MAPKVDQSRYPKRKRADVNYEIDLSIDGDLDLEDDGYVSEELGEESSASVDSTNAHQHELVSVVEDNSEFEDATFGSRRIPKKRKVVTKLKAKAQAKVKPPPEFKPFRLMDLPAELRLKVYEEALIDPHGINIRAYWDAYESVAVHVRPNINLGRYGWPAPHCYIRGGWSKMALAEMPKKKYRLSTNLLAASKTVYHEAVSLLWTQPFIFNNVVTLHQFLLMLRPETISRLRDITILSHGWNNTRCLQTFVLLRDAPLLQNLRLDCNIRSDVRFRTEAPKEAVVGQQLAEKLYRDCYPFLKVLVQHQGVESIRKVIKFSKDEFTRHHLDANTHAWVHKVYSPASQEKILVAMTSELDTILNRKIAPKIPRSHHT